MYDIAILGGGPGGYELALEAQKEGLSVLLIEDGKIGGTCLNEGCIPTKTYYKNAQFLKDLKKANTFGVDIDNYTFDFQKAKSRKNEVVNQLKEGINFLLKKAKIDAINGFGILVDKNTIKVEDNQYQAKNIVIATGAKSIILPGFEDALNSSDVLDLTELPRKLVIIGGGVIGIEIASIFNKFGVDVEIIEYADSIIPVCDLEVSKRLMAYLKQDGIKIHTSTKAIKKDENYIYAIEKENEIKIEYDKILVAVGRSANIEDIGLDEVGIKYNKKGIIVDENFKTNIENIYAIGDVTGKNMLAHYATYSGIAVLKNILGKTHNINFSLVPSCVFTFPEVAWVGITEKEAKDKNLDYKIFKSLYRSNGKSLAMDEVDGYVKMLVVDEYIISCFIIGYDASTLIHEISSLISKKIKVEEFIDIIHAHPTLSENLVSAFK